MPSTGEPNCDKMSPDAAPQRNSPLRRSELPTDSVQLARYLIGKTLVHDLPQGRIERTNRRNRGLDPRGRRCQLRGALHARNRAPFLERGHPTSTSSTAPPSCSNVSSQPAGIGAGILFRAVDAGKNRADAAAPPPLQIVRAHPRAADAGHRFLDRSPSLRIGSMCWRSTVAETGREALQERFTAAPSHSGPPAHKSNPS